MLRTALRQAIAGPWLRDPLWTRARAVPSLDLDFAGTGSLRDRVSGLDLVTFTRASNGTRITSQGTLETLGNDVPRFTHDPSTGRPLGLLIEEARTNLLLRSEEFDNASWTRVGWLAFGSGSTANATTAPNGTLTADLLTESTATNTERAVYQTGIATTTGTLSCFVKPNGRNFCGLRFYAASNNWVRVTFSLAGNGSAGAVVAGSSSDYSASSAVIEPWSNGWYRVALTATRAGGLSFAVVDFATSASPALASPALVAVSGNEFYAGNGTSGIFLWGAQLEAGAFPTSYIPTTGTSANRAADVATGTSGVNFNALRTLYVEFASPASGTRGIVSLNDNTTNERLALNTSTADPLAVCVDGGVTQASLDAGTVTANQMSKFAARFNTNDFAASFNGGAEVTDTSGTLPTVDRIMIGRSQAGEYLNGPIRRIVGWTQALPMLQELGR